MDFGATPQGFVRKTFEDIKSEMEASVRLPESFGTDVDLSAHSPIGIIIQNFANALAINWEALEDNYYAAYLDTATGVDLDRLGRLIGIQRKQAQPETATLSFIGTNYTVIPIGFLIQTASRIQYRTIESKIIANETAAVQAQSLEMGTISRVTSDELKEFVTPISGLDTVTNPLASSGGSLIESDAEYRARILSSTGFIKNSGAISYIKTKLEEKVFIKSVHIAENNLAVEYNGMPANSLAFTVLGGTDEEVAGAIYELKPAAVCTVGDISHSVQTGFSDTVNINFSRPSYVDVYAKIEVKINGRWLNTNVRKLRTAIIEYVGGVDTYTENGQSVTREYEGLGIGDTVIAWQVIPHIGDIPGIDDLRILFGAATGNITQTSLSVAINQIAKTETDFVEVVLV